MKIKHIIIAILESSRFVGAFFSSLRRQNEAEKEKSFQKLYKDQIEKINEYNKYVEKIKKVIINLNIKNPKLLYKNLENKNDIIIQILIFSFSYQKANKFLNLNIEESEIEKLKREYPKFLKEIGFVRAGGANGSLFFIKKKQLVKKIGEMSNLRPFLDYHFKKTRKKEIDILGELTDIKIKKDGKTDQLMPYFYLITENKYTSESFGSLFSEDYILTSTIGKHNTQNDQLKSLLFNSVDFNKLTKIDPKKTPKSIIEENFDLEFVLDNFESISTNKRQEIKETYHDILNTTSILSEEIYLENDKELENQIKNEVAEYKKALNKIGIIIN